MAEENPQRSEAAQRFIDKSKAELERAHQLGLERLPSPDGPYLVDAKNMDTKSLLPKTFNIGQCGCCMVAARIIAGKLLDQERSPDVIEGWIQFVEEDGSQPSDLRFQHTWVELDGEILDPTIKQFDEYLQYYAHEREYEHTIPAKEYIFDPRLNVDDPTMFFDDGVVPIDCMPFLSGSPHMMKFVGYAAEAAQEESKRSSATPEQKPKAPRMRP